MPASTGLSRSAVLPCFVLIAGLAGYAATGTHSPSARAVLYPNAALNREGELQGRAEACMSRAVSAGLAPDENSNALARRAGVGAAAGPWLARWAL